MSDALIYKTPDFTIDELRSAIGYDPDTGVFTRKAAYGRAKAGAVLGTKMRTGYLSVCFKGQSFKAHRLAWFYVHGVMPSSPIDHVNGDRTDNRIENLRCGGFATNNQNRLKPQRNNTSGFLGVGWSKTSKKWKAQITVDNQTKHLGHYNTPEEAHEAYLAAKRKYHKGCNI
jgi:hypothetical protein